VEEDLEIKSIELKSFDLFSGKSNKDFEIVLDDLLTNHQHVVNALLTYLKKNTYNFTDFQVNIIYLSCSLL